MITRNTLRAIALATSCLAPLAAFAQSGPAAPVSGAAPAISIGGTPFTGMAEFGLMGVAGTNPDQYGRYNGLNTTGLDVVGKFELNGGDPWDSGGIRYYHIEGDNLVFQTGNRLGSGVPAGGAGWTNSVTNSLVNNGFIGVQAGDQGVWGINGYFDSITYTGNVIDSLYTVSGGTAFLNPPLIPWGTLVNPTRPQLAATGAMLPVQTGTRRIIFGGDFHYEWNDWTFSGAFRHEHKEGSMEETYDGTWGGMAFAMPIDYDTDRYDAKAFYNTRPFQGLVQYTFSKFSDNNLFVALPYLVGRATAPLQPTAAYSLPPSNSAHYVTIMLGSDILPKTRLNLNARVGVEKQDDTFAPNTADPGLSTALLHAAGLNSMARGTSAMSPDITATIYQMKVSAHSNPIPRLDVNGYYGFDGRSVKLNQFAVNGVGSGGDTALGSPAYAYVVPQDWFKQYLGGDLGYRVLPEYNTKVFAGYRLDMVDRSNAQVGHSWTNTGSVGVTSDFGPEVFGKLSFDYSSRSAKLSYLTPWANLEGAGAAQSFSGAYYQAPKTAESVTLRAEYTPMNNLSLSMFARFKNENYDYPATPLIAGSTPATIPILGVGEGVKQDYILSIGPDVTYRPRENVSLHLFYTYDRLFFDNRGNGACSTAADIAAGGCTGSAGYFQNKSTSDTHTIGVSGEWKATEKLTLKADYTLSYGSVMFTQFNGVFVPNPTLSYQNVSNYPDYNSVLSTIKLMAGYKVTPTVELVGLVAYTTLHNTNWNDRASAIQSAGSTAISILTPGYTSPNYNIAAVMGGVKFRF